MGWYRPSIKSIATSTHDAPVSMSCSQYEQVAATPKDYGVV